MLDSLKKALNKTAQNVEDLLKALADGVIHSPAY